jgi:hypothetical protein
MTVAAQAGEARIGQGSQLLQHGFDDLSHVASSTSNIEE